MCLGFTNLFPTCSFAKDLRDPTSKDTGLKLVEEKMKAGRDALPVAILACGGDAWKANMATFYLNELDSDSHLYLLLGVSLHVAYCNFCGLDLYSRPKGKSL